MSAKVFITQADALTPAARAEADGCLHWAPVDHGPPIGYLCAVRDPDGNVVEFSHGQGVYDKAAEVWGIGHRAT